MTVLGRGGAGDIPSTSSVSAISVIGSPGSPMLGLELLRYTAARLDSGQRSGLSARVMSACSSEIEHNVDISS